MEPLLGGEGRERSDGIERRRRKSEGVELGRAGLSKCLVTIGASVHFHQDERSDMHLDADYASRYLATGARRTVEQFVVVEWTAQFFVETNVAVLRHVKRLVTTGAVQSDRLCHYQLHVSATLTTSAHEYNKQNNEQNAAG